MKNGTIKKRVARAIAGTTLAIAMLGATVVSVQALHRGADDQPNALECLGLLITDPEFHALHCGIGDTSGSGLDWGKTGSNPCRVASLLVAFISVSCV